MPGSAWRWSPAPSAVSAAVADSRGSTTINPPWSRAPDRCWTNGGIVSATLLPSSNTAPARPMSSTGNGSPRSIPNARLPAAAAELMQNRPL